MIKNADAGGSHRALDATLAAVQLQPTGCLDR